MNEPGAARAGRAYLRLVLLGALIGIPAALLAAGFMALVHELEQLLWEDLPDALGHSSAPLYLVIALPVVGAALVRAPAHCCRATAAIRRSGGSPCSRARRWRRWASPWRRSARCPSARCSAPRRR